MIDTNIINNFHTLYYEGRANTTWKSTNWLGVPIQKCPLDLWIYQEIIFEVKPDLIIETGTLYGGSAYFLSHMLDLMGHGKIVTIDIDYRPNRPQHNRLTYLTGSSTSKDVEVQIDNMILNTHKEKGSVPSILVILDSDHSKGHVLNEMKLYQRYVQVGSYLIVEDSNINGNPVYSNFGPGPMEAINDFLRLTDEFIIDRTKEKFMLTFNPNGYLKRIV